ncbi:MAG: glycosyltransferase family 2 protein [Candidatus Obscuribacterales bacterium]|nr:glycosyltransferase family 2 protein [Candidatus Obscuribacterales bacterium]
MLVEPNTLCFKVPQEEKMQSLVAEENDIEISVVVPSYNSRDSIQALYERVSATLVGISPKYEIICTEDCGKDYSYELLLELAAKDSHLRVLKMNRNFGQQTAKTAGLSFSRGRGTAVMDCDLQDQPEFYKKAIEGLDVVLGKRIERQHNAHRKFCASIYAALSRLFAAPAFTGQCGTFSILSRKVFDAYLKFSDRNRHYLLILLWLGFNFADVEYQQAERVGSKSTYSLFSLVRHAIQGDFFQTTVLLPLIVGLGFCFSTSGRFLAVWPAEYSNLGTRLLKDKPVWWSSFCSWVVPSLLAWAS